MQIKSYEEAVKYLESFIGKIRYRIGPEFLKHHDPLERMRVLLNLLDNPQDKFKSVLVGGTSGKGSTAYLISHILETAGYKTGLTISPHLEKVNERLQINGREISDENFTRMVSSIVRYSELMKKSKVGEPSYFEILVALAFLYFVKEKVDIAVVEVGMGGEFDATNTLYPLIAVLTNVSLDHTNVLGKTVQKIARTKGGIIKGSPHPLNDSSSPNLEQPFSLARANTSNHESEDALFKSSFRGETRPIKLPHIKAPRELIQDLFVVTGVKQPSVIKIVEGRCKEVGAKLHRLGKDFKFEIKKENLEGSVFDFWSSSKAESQVRKYVLGSLSLSLLGKYQVENASLAIETVLELRKFGLAVSEEHIKEGLKTAFFPGRFEVINTNSKGSPHPLNDSSALNSDRRLSFARQHISKSKVSKESFKSSFREGARPRHFTLVLDGAHNPTKMKAFVSGLTKLFPKEKKVFIVGFKNDKDIRGMLKEIIKVVDYIIATEFHGKTDVIVRSSKNALNLKSLILNLKSNAKVFVERDSRMALEKAINISARQYDNTIIIVTGSLYLVGEIRSCII